MKYCFRIIQLTFCLFSLFLEAQNSNEHHVRDNDMTSVEITNILSNDFIGKVGGSATGLLKRVSGVSFEAGNLVSFRGLSPRYTSITVDGLATPISEQKVKAFALGLIPSSAFQELDIFKSGSYVNYGEWGGATLNIETTANVNENFTNLSVNVGYQHNITFQQMVRNEDYGDFFGDYFGFGSNNRDLANDIASAAEIQNMTRSEREAEGAKLPNRWGIETVNAAPSFDIGFAFGRKLFENDDKKLSTINSLHYENATTGAHYQRARYSNYERAEGEGTAVTSSELRNYMTDGAWSTKTSLMLNSAWFFQLNDDNHFNLDISYTNQGDNQAMSRYFISPLSDKELYYTQFGLVQKTMFLTRLLGNHEFGKDTDIEWSLGFQDFNRREPDLRRAAAQRNLGTEDPYFLVIPEGSKADQGARFRSDLKDYTVSGRLDLNHDFIDDVFEIKIGFLAEVYNRTFGARLLTNVKDDFTSPELRFVPFNQLGTVFSSENFGPEGYFLNDGTTSFDTYNAQNALVASYLGFDNSWIDGKLKTSIGFRYENFRQDLATGGLDINTNIDSYLPYFNMAYRVSEKATVKANFSKSVNRPAFRELSPFQFFDFDFRANIQGNPDLQTATLSHLDISFLYAFGNNEYFSLTPFYKKIKNPIEMIYVIQADNPAFSFDNTQSAEIGGVEVEFAKFLSNNSNLVFSRLLFTGNLTYTNSVIDLGEDSNEFSTSRPLQGQVPLMANAGLTYGLKNDKGQFTVDFAYKGSALYSVGDGQETFPWYTNERGFLNAGGALNISEKMRLTFTALNLLNTELNIIEDANIDGDLSAEVDKIVQYGLTYQSYRVGVNYRF
ncbi:TonB-dependent receptor plug domain-containing protein [Galbibacter sp. BG1]|uniref:TonB-dependent receptor domain-containing protein n=1 Tax=Galbibacter sp. BG1 TaxID=1170699 RepID=UPI0015C0D3D1|nr:TonB-dependent receptor [Galbibacter sp. BG1]QLE02689.1 TonB-dependent receptor plug domain-containing protein [Galbibacter sp. BG1]